MHPLDKFDFCPMCGSRHFEVNNEKSRRCDNCGFVYYMNPSAATAAFIMNAKGELLVERRGKEPAKGTLDLPGGFVDMDETAEQGLRREIMEETGIEIETEAMEYLFSLPNIYRYSGIDIRTLDLFYLIRVGADVEARADDDAAECMWLPTDGIHTEQFGLRSIRAALRMFLDGRAKKL